MSAPPVVLKLVADTDDANRRITDSTRRMTLMQVEAQKLNAAVSAGSVSVAEASGAIGKHHDALSAWDSILQKANGHVGEHALGMNRLERVMASSAGHALGMNSAMEVLGATSLKFGVGDIYTIAIVTGLAAITWGIEKLTGANTKAIDEGEKLAKTLLKEAHIASLGIGGKFKADIEDLDKAADAAGKKISFLLRAQMAFHGTGIDALIGHFIGNTEDQLKDIGKARPEAEKDRDKAIEKDREERDRKAETALSKQISQAQKAGSAAEREAAEVWKREEKAQTDIQKLRDKGEEDTLRAVGLKDVAEAEAIIHDHDRRVAGLNDREIAAGMNKVLDDNEFSALAALNRGLEDEAERHREKEERKREEAARKREAAIHHNAELIASVERKMAADLVDTRLSFGQRLLKAALEPEVAFLQAKAMSQFEQAAADGFVGDWGGAAGHAAAGLALETGANMVGQIAGGGGGHGGGGGGGGGGGHTAGLGASLGSQGGQSEQVIKVEIVNVTKDQNGREVARTNQMIQRLNDLNTPIRVSL